MTRNKSIKIDQSKRSLNELIRLYERNYQKLIKFFPTSVGNKEISYLIPEGIENQEINIFCRNLSNHTSVMEIKKIKSLEISLNTSILLAITVTPINIPSTTGIPNPSFKDGKIIDLDSASNLSLK